MASRSMFTPYLYIERESTACVEPLLQSGEHLVAVGEPLSEAVSVTTVWVDEEGALVASLLHGRVVGNGIGDGWHEVVIARENEECRWSLAWFHLKVR